MIKNMYLTHFDFVTYITTWNWNTTLLDLDWQTIFTSGVLFALIFIIIYLSFIATKERISIMKNMKYFLMFLYYFVIYKFIMGYIWCKVLIKIVFNKANSWDKVN